MKLWLTRSHALDTMRDGFHSFTLWAAPPLYDRSMRGEDDPGFRNHVVGWTLHPGQFAIATCGSVGVGKAMDTDPVLRAQRDAAYRLMWEQLPTGVFIEGKGWQPHAAWALFRSDPHEHSRFCVEVECSAEFWMATLQAMADGECEMHAWGQARCELPF